MIYRFLVAIITVVAWAGLCLVGLASLVAFVDSFSWVTRGRTVFESSGIFLASFLGLFGVFLALACGFAARPPYHGAATVIVGAIYILSFFGLYGVLWQMSLWYLMISIPGVNCIAGGLIERWLVPNRKPKANPRG